MKTKKEGFTLIEVLISVGILSFVIVSILHGFAQRIQTDRNNGFRNTAIALGEAKLEEYLKFPSNQIPVIFPAKAVDYIILSGGKTPKFFASDPKRSNQYKRTVEVAQNGNLTRVTVTVEYGYIADNNHYPFNIFLTSQRGL